MDFEFFHKMLSVDSTSGKEAELADILAVEMAAPGRKVETYEVGDGTKNVLVSWGVPKVVFCTHLDTVPPYISPAFLYEDGRPVEIRGRGACDAKGQILAMYEACKVLEAEGYRGFGLLLLAGEETGSFGARAFSRSPMPLRAGVEDDWVISGASSEAATGTGICVGKYRKSDRSPMPLRAGVEDDWVIVVGEPTDNCMASAAKGTKSFEVTFTGKAFHSGYPQYGISAIELFNDFVNALRSIRFPLDDTLGETTWNIGRLYSDNPQNILSDKLSCRVYFRTTFESDEMVCSIMKNIAGPDAKLRFGRPQVQDGSDIVAKEVALWQTMMTVEPFGGDSPSRFETLDGFRTKPVSFGSDAPQLTAFRRKILCGPGSILVAHTDQEHILVSDIEEAVDNYVRIFETVNGYKQE